MLRFLTDGNTSAHKREKHDDASPDGSSVHHIDTVGRNDNARVAHTHGFDHITAELQKGALVEQDPTAFGSPDEQT